MTNWVKAKAERMMIKPMMPENKIFLALPTLSSEPPAVIHIIPPQRTITTATIPKMPKAARIILAAVSNTVVKAGMAWFFGEKRFASYVLIISFLILVVGLGSVFLFL